MRTSCSLSGEACNTSTICMCECVYKGTLSHIINLKKRYQIYKFHAHKPSQQGLPHLILVIGESISTKSSNFGFGGLSYGPNCCTFHISGLCCVILGCVV